MANIPQPGIESVPDARPLPTPYDSSPVTVQSQEGAAGVLGDATQAAEHVYQDAKNNADATAVIDALGRAKGALNDDILDADPSGNGYSRLKGQDALAGRDEALKTFDGHLAQIAGSLSNDQQRRAFGMHALTIRDEGYRHAISHESMQIEDLAQGSFRGAADQISRTLQDPAVITQPGERDKQLSDLQRIATAEAVRRYGRSASPEAVQSVVGPIMQKAALDAMEAAVAGQDPTVAKSALDRVGPLLGPHERFYAGVVEKLGAQAQIKAQASAIMDGASTPVVLPGTSDTVQRLSGPTVSQEIEKLQDNPLRSEIEKEVEHRQGAQDRVWKQVVANVLDQARTAGTSAQTGNFNLSSVPIALREWLRQNSPNDLINLGQLEARETRTTFNFGRSQSSQAYADLVTDLWDPTRKDFYLGQTAQQVNKMGTDAGLLPPEQTKLGKEYKKFVDSANKAIEPPATTIKKELAGAFPQNAALQGRLFEPLLSATSQFVEQWKGDTSGKAPKLSDVQQFIRSEIAKGNTKDAGFFSMNKTRIEFERDPANAGKTFVPSDATAPTRPVAPRAGTTRSTGPSAQDQKAMQWLQANPNHPNAPAIRAKLKAKGLL